MLRLLTFKRLNGLALYGKIAAYNFSRGFDFVVVGVGVGGGEGSGSDERGGDSSDSDISLDVRETG